LSQVREVREDEIDAGHVDVGEHQPAVDDEDAVIDLETEAVATDLAEPAEERDRNRRAAHRGQLTVALAASRATPLADARRSASSLALLARRRVAASCIRAGAVLCDFVEEGVLLAGVDPVLELDDTELGKTVA